MWYLCTSERWTSINKYKSPGPNLRSKCATKQLKTSFSWCVWGSNKTSEKTSECSIKSNQPSPIQRQNNELLSVQLVANFFFSRFIDDTFLALFLFHRRDIIKKSFQVSVRHILYQQSIIQSLAERCDKNNWAWKIPFCFFPSFLLCFSLFWTQVSKAASGP